MFLVVKHVVLMQRRDSNDDERDGAVKKPRVVWSVEMHQQFVNAVNQLGVDSKLSCPSAFFEPLADNPFLNSIGILHVA